MICDEVNSVIELFNAHPSKSNGLQASYANSLAKQLSQLPSLTARDGKSIIEVLKSSPYGESTQRLIDIVDTKLKANSSAASSRAHKKQGNNTTQCLIKWWRFLTQLDWDFIRDPKRTIDAKMTRVVERANRLGLCHPDEIALRWLLATLLLAHYDTLPSAREMFNKLSELKQVCVCERKSNTLEIIFIYPDSPFELDEVIFAHAYDVDDPPINVELHGIIQVAERIALRKNSQLLNDDKGGRDTETWRKLKNTVRGSPSSGITITAQGNRIAGLMPVKRELELPSEAGALPEDEMPQNAAENQLFTNYKAGLNKFSADDMPRNPDENQLYTAYKAELWKMRARTSGLLSSTSSIKTEPTIAKSEVPSPPTPPSLSLGLTTSVDATGALCIASRSVDGPAVADGSKKELATKAEPASTTDSTTFEELDPYAKAAIRAMKDRTTKKKRAAKEKRAADKVNKALSMKVAKPVGKLAKLKATKAELKADKIKSEKLKAAKPEPVDVAKKDIMKAMPSAANPDKPVAPAHYNGGIVYTVLRKTKFRALRVKGDEHTETSATWGKSRSQKDAWSHVIKAIDKHHRAKK